MVFASEGETVAGIKSLASAFEADASSIPIHKCPPTISISVVGSQRV
jgi:hypothetical protein